MIFYAPYYDRAWKVAEIDTEKTLGGRKQFRVLPKTPTFPRYIGYCGTIYCVDNCFATYGEALQWINKENPPRLDIERIINESL